MPSNVRNQKPPYVLNSTDLFGFNSQEQEAIGKYSDAVVASVASGAVPVYLPDGTDLSIFDTEQREALQRAFGQVLTEYDDTPIERFKFPWASPAFNTTQVVSLQNSCYKLANAMADAIP